jgi:hypothetical protein
VILQSVFCLLTGGHQWIKLVIPANAFGDGRHEGKICKRRGLIKDLKQKEQQNAEL